MPRTRVQLWSALAGPGTAQEHISTAQALAQTQLWQSGTVWQGRAILAFLSFSLHAFVGKRVGFWRGWFINIWIKEQSSLRDFYCLMSAGDQRSLYLLILHFKQSWYCSILFAKKAWRKQNLPVNTKILLQDSSLKLPRLISKMSGRTFLTLVAQCANK